MHVAACEFERFAVKARNGRSMAGHVDDDRAGVCARAVGASRKNASDNAAARGVRGFEGKSATSKRPLTRCDDAAHAMCLARVPQRR
jgi:hypothetical protein